MCHILLLSSLLFSIIVYVITQLRKHSDGSLTSAHLALAAPELVSKLSESLFLCEISATFKFVQLAVTDIPDHYL